ncbi:MAG: hypothetical protein R3B81_03040 [bacterium]
MAIVGIRAEDKSIWERRVPLVPEDVAKLVADGVEIVVQRSERRCFRDVEYERAGALLADDLVGADVILGVKEVPVAKLLPDRTWMFFSHTIKGQPHNMPMLQTLLDRRGTLLDYELVTDDRGIRTIAFGRFAGLAGAIDTLWALGRRFEAEGLDTPFRRMKQSLEYTDLADACAAVDELAAAIRGGAVPASIAPIVIGVTGQGGKVYGGAREILERLPFRDVAPAHLATALADASPTEVLLVGYGPGDLVEPIAPGTTYTWEDYRDHPAGYRARFGAALPHLTAIVHGILWSPGYPRFILRNDLAAVFENGAHPKLKVLTDVTCDLDGSNEALVRITDPGDPVYVYDPHAGVARDGIHGAGVVVCAVDILPSEIPVDASRLFSRSLTPLVPALARGEFPPALERATIARRGELVPPWDRKLATPLGRREALGGSES